jgi:hypothetical protein
VNRNVAEHASEYGPNTAVFDFDPRGGDAALDLAGELGAGFLEGATRVDDLGARAITIEDASDTPLTIDTELGDEDLVDELPPMSAATESTRFSLEDSEGDGLPDDDELFDDDGEFDLGGDDLEDD